ncbi:neurl4, partial [Symbiodinium sp. CCMP2456]
ELPKAFPAEPFATSEEVPKSLCYGFDGMAHRYNWEELLPIDWNPATLEIGDSVGILCTADGVLQLIVNGVLESEALQVPKDLELFPLVELMGNTLAVSVKVDASPPAIQRKPPKPPE